jgi:hypothetical protein
MHRHPRGLFYDGPQPVLHTVRSSASSFSFQYPIFSLRSSNNCLLLRPRLPVTCPSIFPSVTCFRRQLLGKICPIELDLLLFIVCTISYIPTINVREYYWQLLVTINMIYFIYSSPSSFLFFKHKLSGSGVVVRGRTGLLLNGYRGSLPGEKRSGVEFNHSAPCSAGRMSGAIPLHPVHYFMAWTGKTLPFMGHTIVQTAPKLKEWQIWLRCLCVFPRSLRRNSGIPSQIRQKPPSWTYS